MADHRVDDDELDVVLLHDLGEVLDEYGLVLAVVGACDEDVLEDGVGV